MSEEDSLGGSPHPDFSLGQICWLLVRRGLLSPWLYGVTLQVESATCHATRHLSQMRGSRFPLVHSLTSAAE